MSWGSLVWMVAHGRVREREGSSRDNCQGVRRLMGEFKEQHPAQAFLYENFGKIALVIVVVFAFLLGFIGR